MSASSRTSLRPRRRRRPPAAIAVAGLLAFTAACGGGAGTAVVNETGSTVLRYQGSASQVTFPELAADLGYFENVELQWVGDTTSGPQDIQSAATGDTDFGSAFNGAVVKLAAADSPITSVISSYGADEQSYGGWYTLESGPIREARDLIGKKVGMNTLGAHSEFLVREWLAQQGLTNEEIAQVELTVVPPVSTEQALRQGQIDVGSLSSVFRDTALERGGLRELFTDNSLYGSFSYGTYVFRDAYIEQNPEVVADFVQGTARAIRWTQVTPRDEVVARFSEIIAARGRNENTDLVQYWRSPGIGRPGGVIADQEIQVWVDWLVRNGELDEGRFTATDLFTNEYNPYSNGTYPPDSGPDGGSVEAAR